MESSDQLSRRLLLGLLALSGCPDSPADGTGTSPGSSSGGDGTTTIDVVGSDEGTGTTAADDETTDGDTTDGGSTDTAESTSTTGACAGDELSCEGQCIDPLFDSDFCGATDDCAGPNAGVVCEADRECTDGLCTCAEGIDCDGACIDPLSDSSFCGASSNCMGDNAGELCSPSAACVEGECFETCDNCGFETGDFTDWVVHDLAAPYQPLIVTTGGQVLNDYEVTPTEGAYCAMNGFDGSPGAIQLGQDISLAPETPAELRFDYRASWIFEGTLDRTFDVSIEPAGGGDPLEVVNILTATNGTTEDDTGDLLGRVDLSDYAGQTVFIRFLWNIPESFTGPAQFQLDNVRLVPLQPGHDVSWCVLQHPPNVSVVAGEAFTVYVRLYAEGLTDLTGNNDPDPLLVVELGYGLDGSDPSLGLGAPWTFITADPNPGYGPGAPDYGANNDEYWGELAIPMAGIYDFAGRVSGDGGMTWVYCDLDGLTEGGYTPAQAGHAEVGP